MNSLTFSEDVKTLSSRLHPLCNVLNERRTFLTGGTGFFGKWLLNSFLGLREACGFDLLITVLSRDPKKFLANYPAFNGVKGLDFIAGDVRTFDVPDAHAFDFVIHGATAASATLEQENPGEMFSVITEGTRHMLEFALQCSAERVLYISSGAVYGPQPSSLSQVPETYEGSPSTAYGKGKKFSEQLCLEASAGRFECVIARPFAFVGPYLPLDTHFAIGNFIRDCLENRPIIIRGDGTPLRSYLYAAELAEWLLTILFKGEHTRAYNVGADEAISIRDLAHTVRACAGSTVPIIVQGSSDPSVPPARYVPSIERATLELGLSVRCPLDEAIRRTLSWHRERPRS